MREHHHYSTLVRLFNEAFSQRDGTRLIRGGEAPIYWPADRHIPWARLFFARGFYASALHEVAHWCIAGPARRQLPDFGYWYAPDGRDASQQQAFEQVEVKPQALEWIFAKACGWRFSVSLDNLGGERTDDRPFKRAVLSQVHHYCREGLPARAQRFRDVLAEHYGMGPGPGAEQFTAEELGL